MSLEHREWIDNNSNRNHGDVRIKRSLEALNKTQIVGLCDLSSNRSVHHSVVLALFCIIGTVGVILNVTMIVIYVGRKYKMLNRMVSNRFNLNLVIANLLQVNNEKYSRLLA